MSVSMPEHSSFVLFFAGGMRRGEGRIRFSPMSVAALSWLFPGAMSHGRAWSVFSTCFTQETNFRKITLSNSLFAENRCVTAKAKSLTCWTMVMRSWSTLAQLSKLSPT